MKILKFQQINELLDTPENIERHSIIDRRVAEIDSREEIEIEIDFLKNIIDVLIGKRGAGSINMLTTRIKKRILKLEDLLEKL
jgi:hypothetical protein